GLLHGPGLNDIDFSRLEQIKTTFIRRDYRHLESDIVLKAPLTGTSSSRKTLLIYVLIEHQSEPDRLMPLRLADSQLQIFRYQLRKGAAAHRARGRDRLMPVLPVVFYTGLRPWPRVGTLADLIERGEEFRAVTPIVERPLFLNLPEIDGATLERDGAFFFRLDPPTPPTTSRAGGRVRAFAGARCRPFGGPVRGGLAALA
ncbi:MAG: Rpn family recombination-promoting nuclease/putative transposase, partial [Planctomycetes bacterium]|nr:Rpn family recombination-promoting nuclease/putative transposase [Planctomycetota bacterium]